MVKPETEEVGWHQGHLYDRKLIEGTHKTRLVLVRVRCMVHKEPGDRRRFNDKGEVVEHSEGCFG